MPSGIGTEITGTDAGHEGPLPGYIYDPVGDRYAAAVYGNPWDRASMPPVGATGQIFPVNTGVLEVWWSNLSRTTDPDPEGADPLGTDPPWPSTPRVQWPSKVMRYDAQWLAVTKQIVIARQDGTGSIDSYLDPTLYFQNDRTKPGFNPNDEHALIAQSGSGSAIFALRDDLNTPGTSLPYVLMQYHSPLPSKSWRFKVWQVIHEESPYVFHDWLNISKAQGDPYEGEAGDKVGFPTPLGTDQFPFGSIVRQGVSGPLFQDHKADLWVKAAGGDGKSATVVVRYSYQPSPNWHFFFPKLGGEAQGTTPVPWLSCVGVQDPASSNCGTTGTPIDVSFRVDWPANPPTMLIGQADINGVEGSDAPKLNGNCSVDIIYQQSIQQSGKPSAMLIDPVQRRPPVSLPALPSGVKTAPGAGGLTIFPDLKLPLRDQVAWDPHASPSPQLIFRGELKTDETTGFQYAYLNVMSQMDLGQIQSVLLGAPQAGTLYQNAKDPVEITDSSTQPYDVLALTTGFARGSGYVTLALQNATSCGTAPVDLKIIKVLPNLDPGRIDAIEPPCPFDEKLTLRHRNDFGGHPENYKIEWFFKADANGTPPSPASMTPLTQGPGVVEYTVQGADQKTLSDNWFAAQYTYIGPENVEWKGRPSGFGLFQPVLAEGWIKRILGGIGPFEQRPKGQAAGLAGTEAQFDSYGNGSVNTIVSMISQAGARWAGDVPLSCANLDSFGLIEIYETVFRRGGELSIDGLPPVDYQPANTALLLVASRIADLYTLLGNEAYADAADPTIAFGTDGQYGAEASSIHTFQNVTSSLLEEELALLRGRDDSVSPHVQVHPVYNRLIWNFTKDITGGEVAYALNYNIVDQSGNVDGRIDAADAKRLYPQGHGDAWGHYLTAMQTYYRLLTHPNYTWNNRSEAITVLGTAVTVDYLDERKFAAAAAAKARTGTEIVNLTYRSEYLEDPREQWKGYKDPDSGRAWGFAEWSARAGQGAYFDWVVGNAILPAVDPDHTGIQKIDRTTVPELREVASRFQEIQTQTDTADSGLNPLGLAGNVIPFDIDPAQLSSGKTHFEQIYDRAVVAMDNATTVFNHANNSTQLLRRQADSLADFQQKVEDQEADFKNRLIETFGYPYSDDIGPGRTYPTGYDGPDLIHYDYVDARQLTGLDLANLNVSEVLVRITGLDVIGDGLLNPIPTQVRYNITTGGERFGQTTPGNWLGSRRAPGETQLARSDLLQAVAHVRRALAEYDNLIANIRGQAANLKAQYDLNAAEIAVLTTQQQQQRNLEDVIDVANKSQLYMRNAASSALSIASASVAFLPTNVTLIGGDILAPLRGTILLGAALGAESFSEDADRQSGVVLSKQQALQDVQAGTNLKLTTLRGEFAGKQALLQLEQAVRQEPTQRIELHTVQEVMRQASGRYAAALAKGLRILEDRSRFRRQTATNVQERRYRDMAFRIFRNDALQKYRAQFDLAARYVYLAAKAYDFETTRLSTDSRAGQVFLTNIVRERLIGSVAGGVPQAGVGLANPLAEMAQNFSVLKGQLGFNNPQQETNRFSLRAELFRIQPGAAGNAAWRETLHRQVVPNLPDLPEFQQYASFVKGADLEPGIVISFSTAVQPGMNFFGWPKGGGDNAYSTNHFATKVRSTGMWFSNYDNLSLANTPRVYLIPVGTDMLRSPTDLGAKPLQFTILDQAVPPPFSIGPSSPQLTDPKWIPFADTPSFAAVRKYSDFRAYHDAGQFDVSQVNRTDSRAIGRSIWNTRWLLVIPAESLLGDRGEALKRFIDGRVTNGSARDGNGISDIKIFFETYAYSGAGG